MKLALISDIHENAEQLLIALQAAAASGCKELIFLGDLESISTLHLLRHHWDGELHFVCGNNDWKKGEMVRLADSWEKTTYYGDTGSLNLGGRKLYITHYPYLAEKAAEEGSYDAAFYGHTHIAEQHLCGKCLVANPGEIEGRTPHCSWAIYESESNSLRHIDL